ncbi:MAG: LysR family transcriptional regulator [Solimonas sp.]
MLSRFAIYFDEVARRGSIRRASEHLHITASAIDRQILQMEERLGVPLFERMPQGLRLTAAGELLVGAIRRWRRDIRNIEAQIDGLRGLRRGEVNIALVEGSSEFVIRSLQDFRQRYPGIEYHLQIAVSDQVINRVLGGDADIGVAFNPPERHDLRLERALIYQVGAVMLPAHPLAGHDELTLAECARHALVGPDEGNVLHGILDVAWQRSVGESPRYTASANSITLIKSLVLSGVGIGFLTPIDVSAEVEAGMLRFLPLANTQLPLSALSLISASGRSLSNAASLLLHHLNGTMMREHGPALG